MSFPLKLTVLLIYDFRFMIYESRQALSAERSALCDLYFDI
jgi:hypothetical protein